MKQITADVMMLAMGLLLAGACVSHAVTNRFQEGFAPTVAYVHDAVTIRDNVAGENQNGLDQLIVGTTATDDTLRALLEFDVSAISVSDPINSASLVLTSYSTAGFGGSQTFDLYTYGFDIDEGQATWTNPDAPGTTDAAGGTLGTYLSSATFNTVTDLGTTVTFASTAAFQTAVGSAIADNEGILGLILVHTSETLNTTHEFARFASNSFATKTSRPKLVVITPHTNILVNGDFETGDLTGWTQSTPANGGNVVSSTAPLAGAESLIQTKDTGIGNSLSQTFDAFTTSATVSFIFEVSDPTGFSSGNRSMNVRLEGDGGTINARIVEGVSGSLGDVELYDGATFQPVFTDVVTWGAEESFSLTINSFGVGATYDITVGGSTSTGESYFQGGNITTLDEIVFVNSSIYDNASLKIDNISVILFIPKGTLFLFK